MPEVSKTAQYIKNPDRYGIEIYFTEKLGDAAIVALKLAKWRWHPRKGCQYNQDTTENGIFAKQMCAIDSGDQTGAKTGQGNVKNKASSKQTAKKQIGLKANTEARGKSEADTKTKAKAKVDDEAKARAEAKAQAEAKAKMEAETEAIPKRKPRAVTPTRSGSCAKKFCSVAPARDGYAPDDYRQPAGNCIQGEAG